MLLAASAAGVLLGGFDGGQEFAPGAVRRPVAVVPVDGHPAAEALGEVAPAQSGAGLVEGAVDHHPVLVPPVSTPVDRWQQPNQPLPLGVRQIASMHTLIVTR